MEHILDRNNTVLETSSVKREGVVVLPMRRWKKIEDDLEDLQMYRSKHLAREIEEIRKDKSSVSLSSLMKKYRL